MSKLVIKELAMTILRVVNVQGQVSKLIRVFQSISWMLVCGALVVLVLSTGTSFRTGTITLLFLRSYRTEGSFVCLRYVQPAVSQFCPQTLIDTLHTLVNQSLKHGLVY